MIPQFLIARFGAKAAQRITLAGGVLLLVGLALLVTYCVGRDDGRRGEVVKQQEAEIDTLNDTITANNNASDARVADERRVALEEKELTDALEATADPDRRRTLRGCIVLRQQGQDVAHIPACSRPATDR